MSEENYEQNTDATQTNRTPIYIVAAIVSALMLLIGFGIWYFFARETGVAVSPPQNISFGDNIAKTTDMLAGQTVVIQPDQIDKIGLQLETVGETLSNEAISVAATGVVQPNAYKETPVISLLGGVIRSVSGELGQYVQKGRPIGVVFSDELAAAQSKYIALQTDAQTARQNYERTAKLVKISPVSNAELDAALTARTVADAELEEHHKHHARTQKLLAIGAASREELEVATSKLVAAEATAIEAKRRYQRAVAVAEINPVSRGDFEQAAVKRQTAESDLATAKQRLLLLGLSPQKVNLLHSPSQITSEIALTAPVSGTITKRMINQGEIVEANKELMRVTDLSTVWVIAQVYEKDVAELRVGGGASVTTDSFPDKLFRGHVTYIDPNIDPATRTVQARVELDNSETLLKLGMYVNVAFASTGNAERTMPTVPVASVQNINDTKVVFVTTDKANVFTVKPVRLGMQNGSQFTVIEGVNVGDKVVTEGSFLLRAELLR